MAADNAIKNHAAERSMFLLRTAVAGAVIAVLVGVLLFRVSYLQVLRHGYYETRSQDNRMRVQVMPPVRGLIYDRNGVILADNLPAYRLEIVPEQVEDLSATLDRLANIIEIRDADRDRFHERVAKTPRFRGVPIRLNLSQREVARFEVNRGDFPGVEIRAGLTRHYPLGAVAAHLVGYVGGITVQDLRRVDEKRYRGSNHIGKSGVEYSYESRLHGEPGSRVVETNASGRALRELEMNRPTAGESLYLTIDARLQKAAFDALGDQDGAVVAMDPNTGGLLALVSKPSYDPDLFVDGISHINYKRLITDPHKPLFNRALQGQYPPGSTVKPVMALAGLETDQIEADKQVWCPGFITLPGSNHRYRDWKRSGHGWVDMPEAIFRSSDVYFYKLGLKLGIDNIHRYGELFGLGARTGVDLPRENSGIMPSRAWKNGTRNQPWYPGETLNTIIGQGFMTTTPLQLAQMTSRIAGRGDGYKPHVLRAWKNPVDGSVTSSTPTPLRPIQLNDPAHWQVVIKGMEEVIGNPRGTAYHYVGQNLDYTIAGKSGSAQVTKLAQNEAAPDLEDVEHQFRDHALFVAFAPIENPEIAVAVLVEHGGGGSSVAGPVARQVIDAFRAQPPVLQASTGSGR
ncbi:penicillin-binding protein 2 [Endozoicomonas sp. G2_2]|uniref:penicillin-binding protein 2 n=1 Tax=Endozoicomonas sp. G2_2 TaxID=2821092 RepID=UPI001ADA499D|nr:penicillin-binding protein 2 [Endozoicomonas sp. G2_2]MBO9471195.1 penicillin-binding protein 2 [Endozoicomonas sp. G2_2]